MGVVDVLEVSILMVLFSLHIYENLSYICVCVCVFIIHIYACLYMYVVSYLGYLGLENTYRPIIN